MNPSDSSYSRDIAARLELARRTLRIEADAILGLIDRLDADFAKAVQLVLDCRGRVIVSGIGKSGHIARKIAATLSSTGTPAYFVHPAEASHGDLGMITRDDLLLALSNSGESEELVFIVPIVKRQGARLIAITGNPQSTLAREADAHLDAAVRQEACPLNLAPTASTTAALALGDALAVALLEARGFGEEDFARSHPGGSLGRRLLTHVRDVMHSNALPTVGPQAGVSEAILAMSHGGLGLVAIVDDGKRTLGIFTDGDLRRHIDTPDLPNRIIDDLMSKRPISIRTGQLAVDVLALFQQHNIDDLLVLDDQNRLAGSVDIQDLPKFKIL